MIHFYASHENDVMMHFYASHENDSCGLQPRRRHLHVGQHGVVAGDPGEVILQNGDGAGQSHMAAAAEQGHAGEAEDGSHQRRVRHAA